MLLLLRMILLTVLIVLVTIFGTIFCLFTLSSKNRVHHVAGTFHKFAPLFGLTVEARISPLSKDSPQAVYIANHQNNFDLFTLPIVSPKGAVTVGKKSLRWVPFFGTLYWISGNILLDRDNRKKAIKTIDQIVSNMKETGVSIWMFPEGTRSRGRGWLPFKRGAFYAAVQAGVPIVPIVCSNTHGQVNLNRLNNGKAIVEMLAPIDTSNYHEKDVTELLKECERVMKETQLRLDAELKNA